MWANSTAGLLSIRKWGAAFSIFVLVYTLSKSVDIIIYYGLWINAVRVAVNVPVIVYLFKALFEDKFKQPKTSEKFGYHDGKFRLSAPSNF